MILACGYPPNHLAGVTRRAATDDDETMNCILIAAVLASAGQNENGVFLEETHLEAFVMAFCWGSFHSIFADSGC
jgi:hypothetical protein